MDVIDELFAVYSMVIFVCGAIAALAGLSAAVMAFGVLMLGVEFAHWMGDRLTAPGRLSA